MQLQCPMTHRITTLRRIECRWPRSGCEECEVIRAIVIEDSRYLLRGLIEGWLLAAVYRVQVAPQRLRAAVPSEVNRAILVAVSRYLRRGLF